jgi:predicted DNA-binding protein
MDSTTTDRQIATVAAEIPLSAYRILEKFCERNDRTKSYVIRSLIISWANRQRKQQAK